MKNQENTIHNQKKKNSRSKHIGNSDTGNYQTKTLKTL